MKDYSGKKLLDHIFIERKAGISARTGEPYEFLKASIHIERFIDELRKVAANDKGFANFNINKHRDNPDKFSFVVDDWKPNGAGSTTQASTSNRASAPKPSETFAPSGASDDLPF